MKRTAWLWAILLVAGASAGCVTRNYTINSDPQGATVYRNGVMIGSTPVDDYFVYYGKYQFTLVKEGFEPMTVEQKIGAPWYEIPGIDFFTENVYPCKVRDHRVFNYSLQPMQTVRPDDILQRATDLRSRGKTIQPPPGAQLPPGNGQGPAAPAGPRLPAPTEVAPAPQPLPPAGP